MYSDEAGIQGGAISLNARFCILENCEFINNRRMTESCIYNYCLNRRKRSIIMIFVPTISIIIMIALLIRKKTNKGKANNEQHDFDEQRKRNEITSKIFKS